MPRISGFSVQANRTPPPKHQLLKLAQRVQITGGLLWIRSRIKQEPHQQLLGSELHLSRRRP